MTDSALQVDWEKDRFDEIQESLQPFLAQTGFNAANAQFVPVGALSGVNLATRDNEEGAALNTWYSGPTLVDLLGKSYLNCCDYTSSNYLA